MSLPASIGRRWRETFLRERLDEVWASLGGAELDHPAVELFERLGVKLVYCTDDTTAREAVAGMGNGPIAIDIETAPRPEYANPISLRLTVRGRPMKIQPKPNDRVGLDPHRSEPRLVQLYDGGDRVVVLDMQRVSWTMLQPLWQRPLVAHNAAFELAFLAKRAIRPRMDCSMQAAGLLLGVEQRRLDDACFSYLGVEVPKDLQRRGRRHPRRAK